MEARRNARETELKHNKCGLNRTAMCGGNGRAGKRNKTQPVRPVRESDDGEEREQGELSERANNLRASKQLASGKRARVCLVT